MPHLRPHLSRRILARLVMPIAAVLAAAPAARGQDCLPPGQEQQQSQPVCNFPPMVSLTPLDTHLAQPSVRVAIRAQDHLVHGDTGSFRVTVDGVDVTASWSRSSAVTGSGTGRMWSVASDGTVALSETVRRRVIQVELCDVHENVRACTVRSAAYTLSIPGVQVTPDADTATVQAGAAVRAFTVRNTGTDTATFRLTAECRNAATWAAVGGCTPSAATLHLPADSAAPVSVTFPAGAETSLTVKLTAAQAAGVEDAGWVDVTVAGSGIYHFAPQVAMVDLNSATQLERGRCVTVSAGAGAAYECGDLRLAHALPATATRGRMRAPVLLYNSAHAEPRPLLYADVALASAAARPDSLVAVVTLADGRTFRRSWPGSQWASGTTRRVAIELGDLGATGVYAWTLQMRNWYQGTPYLAPAIQGELTFVSRRDSPFGAGWWLAGLERVIYLPDGARALMVGGDGSARVYRWVSTGRLVADPVVDRPDTLRQTYVDAQVWTWRRLPGGTTVWFDPSGRHVRTVNRLGDTTEFGYTGASLAFVTVPRRDGQPPARYEFHYDAQGRLASVTAPPNGAQTRTVTLAYALGDRRVTGIQDPDLFWVRFGYASTPRPAVVTSRTDRRGTVVGYGYDAAGKLASVKLPLAPGDTIVRRFEALEGKGLAASVPLAQAYTVLDGARTDVGDRTWLWLDRWGAPRRIRDALGGETVVRRADPRFPALPTEVTAPGGRVSRAAYDTRGRVAALTLVDPLGDGQNAVTSYTYDDRWDAPATITAPLVGVVRMEYDSLTGNVLSQRQGEDAARTTRFLYYASGPAAGLLRAVQAPADGQGQVARDSLVYDAWGNLRMTVSPLGFRTLHFRDALGRDTLSVTPIDSAAAVDSAALYASGARQRTVYDVMDQPRVTVSVGPALAHAPNPDATFTPPPSAREEVTVETAYDPEGQSLTVTRRVSPDPNGLGDQVTVYTYDAAGRRKTESARVDTTLLLTKRFDYDHAGNVTALTTPRGLATTSRYDALGRLQRRVTPAAAYAQSSCADPCLQPRFPMHPNDGAGYRIPEEWTTFRYDATGALVYAENADAVIVRGYYPGGALKTDSLRIRAEDATDFTTHRYGLRYGYDLAGRVTSVEHPANLAGPGSRDQYGYEPVTGALASVDDRFGNPFRFGYDVAGRMTSIRMPPGPSPVLDSLAYDVEGRLVWRRETTPAAVPLQDERMAYDARGKLVRTQVLPTLRRGGSTYTQWYSGLGNLVATDWTNMIGLAWAREQFVIDPLGNLAHRRTHLPGVEGPNNDFPDYEYRYDGLARVRQVLKVDVAAQPALGDNTERYFDASGNRVRGMQDVDGIYSSGVPGPVQEIDDASYYAADERLRVFQQYDRNRETGRGRGMWEEYGYDPLGRRVLVRTRRDQPYCDVAGPACLGSVTRFVWSGDQILWEVKEVESSSYAAEMGGRVSYLHAGGIDRPLAIWKQGVGTVVTHQNWRGQFALGTFTSGQPSDCTEYPPQGCIPVRWPGWATTAWHQEVQNAPVTGYEHYWLGSLAVEMRDASGQLYRRNRYYDPATGQFTQPDPIGLAGGLNAYGFAEGDPVSYTDPYGLKVIFGGDSAAARQVWNDLRSRAEEAQQSRNWFIHRHGTAILRLMDQAERSETVYAIQALDLNSLGGGQEFSDPDIQGLHIIQIDPDGSPGQKSSPWIILAHELGGAVGRWGHAIPALQAENSARWIAGCLPRWGHGTDLYPDCHKP